VEAVQPGIEVRLERTLGDWDSRRALSGARRPTDHSCAHRMPTEAREAAGMTVDPAITCVHVAALLAPTSRETPTSQRLLSLICTSTVVAS
jgi:hypothetical protein